MNSNVTVYGKPDCYGCKATVRQLTKDGIPHQYLDVTVNEIASAEVKNLGFTSLPVVVPSTGKPWTGYSPDRLKALKGVE